MSITAESRSASLSGISVTQALNAIATELKLGFNFERYGVAIASIDIEHFLHALNLVRLLLDAYGPAASPAQIHGSPAFEALESSDTAIVTTGGLT